MKSQLIKRIVLMVSCLIVLAYTQTWAQTDLDLIKKSLPQPIVRTPNPNDTHLYLPLEILIEGISMQDKDIKTIKGYECQLMAFDAVARFYGKNIPWKEILMNVSTSLLSLQDYAIKRGFKCASFFDCNEDKRKIKFYLSQNIPVFIHTKIGEGNGGHTVLVIGYNDRGRAFFYLDSQDMLTNRNWKNVRHWGHESFNSFHHAELDFGCVIYDASMTIDKTQPYCEKWDQPVPQPRLKYE